MLRPDCPLEILPPPHGALTLDDQVWYRSLMVHQYTSAMRVPHNNMNKVESYLWESLRDGAYDFHNDDGQWESSYQSMHYSTTNNTLLWMLSNRESTQVGPPFHNVNVLIITD